MSIPTLLVCDGDESRQEILEKLIKSEPGLKYIATVGTQHGPRAVDQALKVGGRLIWIDLEEDTDKAIDLMVEVKNQFPQAAMVASKNSTTPELTKIVLGLGALDIIEPKTWQAQIQGAIARMANPQATSQATPQPAPAQPAPAQPAPAQAAPQPAPVQPAPAPTNGSGGNKWGDLDSIPTPGAAASPGNTAQTSPAKAQEATGEINVAQMQRPAVTASPQLSTAPATAPQFEAPLPQPAAQESGSRWGDLDSIPTPGAPAPAASTNPAPAPAPAPAPVPAPAPAPVPAPAPAPAPAFEAPAAVAAQTASTDGSKWGDLDAIPTPKAVTSKTPSPDVGGLSLDDIPTPGQNLAPGEKPPPPVLKPHKSDAVHLRPSPSKAEMYNMPSTPAWMLGVILLVIIICAAYYFYSKSHGVH